MALKAVHMQDCVIGLSKIGLDLSGYKTLPVRDETLDMHLFHSADGFEPSLQEFETRFLQDSFSFSILFCK